MAKEIVEVLVGRAHDFADRIDFGKIESQLQSDLPGDRMDSLLFTVYHLLFAGAVAEENVAAFAIGGPLPRRVAEMATPADCVANVEAWRGAAFGDTRNILGGVAFLVAILFFFEGFCKLVHEPRIRADLAWKKRRKLNLGPIVKWLEEHRRINADQMKAVKFLTAYRNAFHEFGRHSGRDLESKGCWLRDGDRLPTLDQTRRIEMLEDLLDVFLEVNADRQ